MVESKEIQTVVNQAAIQAATAIMMMLRGADAKSQLASVANLREPQQMRHGRPALEKHWFNWNAQEKYIELLNF